MFMFLFKKQGRSSSAFTLIELLVVIAIIAIIATLSVLALQSAREKARDSKRIADIKQLKTALELYYNDANGYPPATSFISGSALSYTDSQSGQVKTYINQIPSSPIPADGDCTSSNNAYTYGSENSSTYTLSYCLGGKSQEIPKGLNLATPAQLYGAVSGGGSCTDTSWTPDISTLCGSNITQTSNCGNTRQMTSSYFCATGTICNNSNNQCEAGTLNLAHASSISDGQDGALLSAPRSVAISGNYAYVVSTNSNALEIIDISNPLSPTHASSISNGQGGALLLAPISIAIFGNYAYVTGYAIDALEIIKLFD
jgi:prepilin-type N-terminal cleavage/methylation domain-containing protein